MVGASDHDWRKGFSLAQTTDAFAGGARPFRPGVAYSGLRLSYEMVPNGQIQNLWALGVYFVVVLLLVASMLAISYVLGQRHEESATGSPYESGILSEGSARVRLSAKFYQIAMFFVIFDLEAVFIFAWAVAARELGWIGYGEIVIFIAILVVALVYLWRLGALDWSPRPRSIRLVE